MSAVSFTPDEKRRWLISGLAALTLHLALVISAVAWTKETIPAVPEPVVLIELPPAASPPPAASVTETTQPDVAPFQQAAPLFDVPVTRAPLPVDPVILPDRSSTPQPQPAPARKISPAPAAASPQNIPVSPVTAPATNNTAVSTTSGNDPKARKEKANYFAMVSAHLNRRKKYPSEARKARQQGVVKVRFTVDRSGNVSGVSIRGSSGFDILDQATISLMQRVAPLPKMPASMTQSSVTITLPIDYSLRTS